MSRVGLLDCNSERSLAGCRESPGLAVRSYGFESYAGGPQADFSAKAASGAKAKTDGRLPKGPSQLKHKLGWEPAGGGGDP